MVRGRAQVQPHRPGRHAAALGRRTSSRPPRSCRAAPSATITLVRCWNVGNQRPRGSATRPTASRPQASTGTCGSARRRRCRSTPNRFGVVPDACSHFRWFWDYAGGMMTDWGVHLIDIVQMAMNVDAPLAVSTIGGKFHLDDNRETPDTILATYHYPDFVMTYENRVCNGSDQRPRLRHRVLRHRGHAVRRSRAIRGHARAGAAARRRPSRRIEDRDRRASRRARGQPDARAQLHRLREVAPGADLRHRDRPSLVVDRDSRQHGAAIGPDGGVGRQGRAVTNGNRKAQASDARVSRAVEAGGLARAAGLRAGSELSRLAEPYIQPAAARASAPWSNGSWRACSGPP